MDEDATPAPSAMDDCTGCYLYGVCISLLASTIQSLGYTLWKVQKSECVGSFCALRHRHWKALSSCIVLAMRTCSHTQVHHLKEEERLQNLFASPQQPTEPHLEGTRRQTAAELTELTRLGDGVSEGCVDEEVGETSEERRRHRCTGGGRSGGS